VLGHAPLGVALALAIPMHSAFAVITPVRIVPFSLCSIALLCVAHI
jgi:hypothetical protein